MGDSGHTNLRLADVDIRNFYTVMLLELADHQRDFAWTNSGSLTEAAYIPGFWPRALYLDDEPIGLGVWGPYYPNHEYEQTAEPGTYIIDHLMIDRRHQGEGYSRRFIELLVAEINRTSDCGRILLGVDPNNSHALAIYRKFGFVDIGRDHENNILMELRSTRRRST